MAQYVESNLTFNSFEEVLKGYKKDPTNPVLRLHAIYGWDQHGQHDKALEIYDESREIFAKTTEFNYLLSDILLKNRRYKDGWAMWQYRPNFLDLQKANKDCPVWDGSPLNGRTLLVAGEHGIGDQIMFSRYLKPLSEQDGNVICYLEMPVLLDGLLSKVSKIPVISDPKLLNEVENIDCWTALGSLPYNLGLEAPSPESYINLKTYSLMASSKRKVGLCWKGNPNNQRDQWRSFEFDVMRSLLNVPCYEFYSLQKDEEVEDVMNLCKYTQNFLDLAVMITGLDLIITVDTSIAHLAGAMGKDVWILLPIPAGQACDWRWGNGGEKSEWYGSARLFWQTEPGDWRGVIKDVESALWELKKFKHWELPNVKLMDGY